MASRFRFSLVAAALALVVLAAWGIVFQLAVRAPDAPLLVSDATYYADIARSLARGEGYVDRAVRPVEAAAFDQGPPAPSGFWSPIYPVLTALAFRATGSIATITERPLVPVLVNLAGHLAAVLALYALARRVAPELAWIAPLGLALDPRAVLNATDGLGEGWSAATLVLTALALVAGRRRLAGVAFAASVLTRVSNVAFLPAYLLAAAVDDRTPSGVRGAGARRMVAFVLPALLPLAAWAMFRTATAGTPFFEIQRYNLLHDLGPFAGSSAFRSLETPSPGEYLVGHPLAVTAKLVTGLAKCLVLLPGTYWNVFALAAAAFGIAHLVVRVRRGDRTAAATAILLAGPALLQLPVLALTLLDARLWLPPSVPLWVAAALGIGELVRRLPGAPRRTVVGLTVALVAFVPFARLAGDLATAAPERRLALRGAIETETARDAVAALVRGRIREGAVILAARDEIVWPADRCVLTRPDSPSELSSLHRISPIDYVLWEPGAGGSRMATFDADDTDADSAWAGVLADLEASGRVVRVADTTVAGRRIVLVSGPGGP